MKEMNPTLKKKLLNILQYIIVLLIILICAGISEPCMIGLILLIIGAI